MAGSEPAIGAELARGRRSTVFQPGTNEHLARSFSDSLADEDARHTRSSR
jgi:hypothetical protein